MERIRISAVSYLNTLPFVHGLRKGALAGRIDLNLDTPARCTARLAGGEADIGLVPVASLSMHPFRIVSDYCIGADGRVDSVLLLSPVPLSQIGRIALDYQSITSVALARVLEERLWKTGARFESTRPGYEDTLQGDRAGIVIGDRALALRKRFPYVYDLAAEWKKLTGKPFVFACWAALTPPPGDFMAAFNEALAWGVNEAGHLNNPSLEPGITLSEQAEYLSHCIRYRLDDAARDALRFFLDCAAPYVSAGNAANVPRA